MEDMPTQVKPPVPLVWGRRVRGNPVDCTGVRKFKQRSVGILHVLPLFDRKNVITGSALARFRFRQTHYVSDARLLADARAFATIYTGATVSR